MLSLYNISYLSLHCGSVSGTIRPKNLSSKTVPSVPKVSRTQVLSGGGKAPTPLPACTSTSVGEDQCLSDAIVVGEDDLNFLVFASFLSASQQRR